MPMKVLNGLTWLTLKVKDQTDAVHQDHQRKEQGQIQEPIRQSVHWQAGEVLLCQRWQFQKETQKVNRRNFFALLSAVAAIGLPTLRAGKPYLIGDQGPDLFAPKTLGRISASPAWIDLPEVYFQAADSEPVLVWQNGDCIICKSHS